MFFIVLFPLELLYRLGFFLAFHFKKYRGNKKYPFKIISIGNLTVGGTGKSVVLPFILNRLDRSRSVIVMRGYKGAAIRDGISHMVTDGKRIFLSAIDSGDEAMMYAQQEQVPVVVGKDRAASCDLLVSYVKETRKPIDFVFLDDAYQNHAVKKDFEVLLIDAREPFDNGHCLPAGYLREKDYTRADVIFLTHADKVSQGQRKNITQTLLDKKPAAHIFYGRHAPAGVYRNNLHLIDSEELKKKKFILVAGVGSFAGLLQTVQQAGIEIAKTIQYKDHYSYTSQDMALFFDGVKSLSADGILTTAKDWVKMAHLIEDNQDFEALPIYVLRVSFEFFYDDEYARFDQLLREKIL